jgi:hypothetical protein
MKTAVLASLVAAAAAAPAPQVGTPNPDLSYFQIMALRSASPIHFGQFNAAQESIWLNYQGQNASCMAGTTDGPAYFQLNSADKTLWLYASGNPRQELYADRSGMGQGKLGYTTGAQPAPKNAEREGWEVDETGNISFNGAGLIACRSGAEDPFSVWVSTGVEKPAGHTECYGMSARTVEVEFDNLQDCYYSNIEA